MTEARIKVETLKTYDIVWDMTFGKIGREHIHWMTKIIVHALIRKARSCYAMLDIELSDDNTGKKGGDRYFIELKIPTDADPKDGVGTVMGGDGMFALCTEFEDGMFALWTDVEYALKDAFRKLEMDE